MFIQVDKDVSSIINSNLPWEDLSGARILVTGANGFIGFYLSVVLLELHKREIISEPITLVALVRDKERAKKRFGKYLTSGANITLFEWDLNSVSVPAIGDVNYIFHAASQASPKYYGVDPVGTLMPNVIGTAALLTVASNSKKFRGFLFVSSSEVYGNIEHSDGILESEYGVIDPVNVRSCYSESKRMGETMCVCWNQQHGIPVKIVRPFHTYGPGLTREDGRVFADFAYSVADGKSIAMNSDGSAVRAFCYIKDAITGMFYVLFHGENAVAYNLSNEDAILSVKELAELLVSLAPEKDLNVLTKTDVSEGYIKSRVSKVVPNTARLRALGWNPTTAPAEGFLNMIEAIRCED